MPTKIRPIVFKVNEPERFVMNASNATFTQVGNDVYVSWQGPAYPNAYDGGGKQYILVNNNADATVMNQLMYANTSNGGGGDAISGVAMRTPGTSTGTLFSNSIPPEVGYGKYLNIPISMTTTQMTLEQVQEYIANVTITILDP